MSKYLLNSLYYPCQCKCESIMRGLQFSHRFWWRCRVFWDMGMNPCRLVNSNDQDHISDDLNHPEPTASPNDCRNPVISSSVDSENLLSAGAEAAKLCNESTSRRLNKGMWDGMGNRKCTYSFGWTSSRMCHLRRGKIVFLESCYLTTPSVAKLMSGRWCMNEWTWWSIGWIIRTEENRGTWRKTCSSNLVFTTNPTWSDLGLPSEEPATNCLISDIAEGNSKSYHTVNVHWL